MKELPLKIKNKILNLVQEILNVYPIETMGFEITDDHSGDEAIFIDIYYRLNPSEFDPAVITRLLSTVRAMLIGEGETRFPYIRHHLENDQKVKAA